MKKTNQSHFVDMSGDAREVPMVYMKLKDEADPIDWEK